MWASPCAPPPSSARPILFRFRGAPERGVAKRTDNTRHTERSRSRAGRITASLCTGTSRSHVLSNEPLPANSHAPVRFAQRAIQPQGQPLTGRPWVIHRLGVNQHGVNDRAEFQQRTPFSAIACQARRLNGKDRSSFLRACRGKKALKTRAPDDAGGASSKIVIGNPLEEATTNHLGRIAHVHVRRSTPAQ